MFVYFCSVGKQKAVSGVQVAVTVAAAVKLNKTVKTIEAIYRFAALQSHPQLRFYLSDCIIFHNYGLHNRN